MHTYGNIFLGDNKKLESGYLEEQECLHVCWGYVGDEGCGTEGDFTSNFLCYWNYLMHILIFITRVELWAIFTFFYISIKICMKITLKMNILK